MNKTGSHDTNLYAVCPNNALQNFCSFLLFGHHYNECYPTEKELLIALEYRWVIIAGTPWIKGSREPYTAEHQHSKKNRGADLSKAIKVSPAQSCLLKAEVTSLKLCHCLY